jgi:hypothetical protein
MDEPAGAPPIIINNAASSSASAAASAGGGRSGRRRRQSKGVHVALLFVTAGIGNVGYACYVWGWNRALGY